jgi:hypothetical protein
MPDAKAIEPGFEISFLSKLGEGSKDVEENVLTGILKLVRLHAQAPQDVDGGLVVAPM